MHPQASARRLQSLQQASFPSSGDSMARAPAPFLPSLSPEFADGVPFEVEDKLDADEAALGPVDAAYGRAPMSQTQLHKLHRFFGISQADLEHHRRYKKLMRMFGAPEFPLTPPAERWQDRVAPDARRPAPAAATRRCKPVIANYFAPVMSRQEETSTEKLRSRFGLTKDEFDAFSKYQRFTNTGRKVFGDLPTQSEFEEHQSRPSAVAVAAAAVASLVGNAADGELPPPRRTTSPPSRTHRHLARWRARRRRHQRRKSNTAPGGLFARVRRSAAEAASSAAAAAAGATRAPLAAADELPRLASAAEQRGRRRQRACRSGDATPAAAAEAAVGASSRRHARAHVRPNERYDHDQDRLAERSKLERVLGMSFEELAYFGRFGKVTSILGAFPDDIDQSHLSQVANSYPPRYSSPASSTPSTSRPTSRSGSPAPARFVPLVAASAAGAAAATTAAAGPARVSEAPRPSFSPPGRDRASSQTALLPASSSSGSNSSGSNSSGSGSSVAVDAAVAPRGRGPMMSAAARRRRRRR